MSPNFDNVNYQWTRSDHVCIERPYCGYFPYKRNKHNNVCRGLNTTFLCGLPTPRDDYICSVSRTSPSNHALITAIYRNPPMSNEEQNYHILMREQGRRVEKEKSRTTSSAQIFVAGIYSPLTCGENLPSSQKRAKGFSRREGVM